MRKPSKHWQIDFVFIILFATYIKAVYIPGGSIWRFLHDIALQFNT